VNLVRSGLAPLTWGANWRRGCRWWCRRECIWAHAPAQLHGVQIARL